MSAEFDFDDELELDRIYGGEGPHNTQDTSIEAAAALDLRKRAEMRQTLLRFEVYGATNLQLEDVVDDDANRQRGASARVKELVQDALVVCTLRKRLNDGTNKQAWVWIAIEFVPEELRAVYVEYSRNVVNGIEHAHRVRKSIDMIIRVARDLLSEEELEVVAAAQAIAKRIETTLRRRPRPPPLPEGPKPLVVIQLEAKPRPRRKAKAPKQPRVRKGAAPAPTPAPAPALVAAPTVAPAVVVQLSAYAPIEIPEPPPPADRAEDGRIRIRTIDGKELLL